MIYGISDLHLDNSKEKDMSIFGGQWEDYESKIYRNWLSHIKEDDLVLIPGDISWAMTLEEAKADLDRLDSLPGTKVLLKGNHDYWWESLNKLQKLAYQSLFFLQNTAFVFKGVRIVGSRGWENPKPFDEKNKKIFKREIQRLELSLLDPVCEYASTICMTHYPPFTGEGKLNAYGQRIVEEDIEVCVYGHLHGHGLHQVIETKIENTEFYCISADYINFKAKKLVL